MYRSVYIYICIYIYIYIYIFPQRAGHVFEIPLHGRHDSGWHAYAAKTHFLHHHATHPHPPSHKEPAQGKGMAGEGSPPQTENAGNSFDVVGGTGTRAPPGARAADMYPGRPEEHVKRERGRYAWGEGAQSEAAFLEALGDVLRASAPPPAGGAGRLRQGSLDGYPAVECRRIHSGDDLVVSVGFFLCRGGGRSKARDLSLCVAHFDARILPLVRLSLPCALSLLECVHAST